MICSDCPCSTRNTNRIMCCMERWKEEPETRQQRRAREREEAKSKAV